MADPYFHLQKTKDGKQFYFNLIATYPLSLIQPEKGNPNG